MSLREREAASTLGTITGICKISVDEGEELYSLMGFVYLGLLQSRDMIDAGPRATDVFRCPYFRRFVERRVSSVVIPKFVPARAGASETRIRFAQLETR